MLIHVVHIFTLEIIDVLESLWYMYVHGEKIIILLKKTHLFVKLVS